MTELEFYQLLFVELELGEDEIFWDNEKLMFSGNEYQMKKVLKNIYDHSISEPVNIQFCNGFYSFNLGELLESKDINPENILERKNA